MRRMRRHYEIDMTHGPLFKKILLFSVPLMLTGILQLLFNAADIVVVGRFAGAAEMAAVSATSALINLTVNLFIGLSIGASVAVANHYGAGQHKDVNEAVHTAICISLIAGVAVGVLGMVTARALLELTGTPEDVIAQASTYMTIYFAGMPASMVYNFGAAVLRAVGDTRRPLYYLSIAGVVNVILNLVSVIGFNMGAAGVAIATVMSYVVSAVLILICLCRSHGAIHLRFKDIRLHKDKVVQIAKVGVPAGLQSTIFSISNVMIQAQINSFGSATIAGNGAASNLEGFVNITMNAVSQASLSFASQNMGAGKYRRVGKVVLQCSLLVTGIALAMGLGMIALGRPLLGIYTSDQHVIGQGLIRLTIICSTYFTCGLMDNFACSLRGMGHSVMPMLVSAIGVVGIRITWLYTVFAHYHTLVELYWSYPVSWTATTLVHMGCFFVIYKKLVKRELPTCD